MVSWSRRKRERPREARRARRACEELLSEHRGALYAYALGVCGGREADAEDLLQDGVLRAFRGWAELRAPEAARAWLLTIVTRTHLNRTLRAAQYWDGHRVLTDAYDRMLALSGPCAGIFMLYGRQARWESAEPPRPDYLEDAHAREFNRPNPQYEAHRLEDKPREMLNTRNK